MEYSPGVCSHLKYNLQTVGVVWGTVCSKYNLETLSLSGELKYNLQALGMGWSTVSQKSDESGGKVGSSLHCLQIKSLDGLINPQTVRHNVETKLLASPRQNQLMFTFISTLFHSVYLTT